MSTQLSLTSKVYNELSNVSKHNYSLEDKGARITLEDIYGDVKGSGATIKKAFADALYKNTLYCDDLILDDPEDDTEHELKARKCLLERINLNKTASCNIGLLSFHMND